MCSARSEVYFDIFEREIPVIPPLAYSNVRSVEGCFLRKSFMRGLLIYLGEKKWRVMHVVMYLAYGYITKLQSWVDFLILHILKK
jgi:hypothetical protein